MTEGEHPLVAMRHELAAMSRIAEILLDLPSDEMRFRVLAAVAALLGFGDLTDQAIESARLCARRDR